MASTTERAIDSSWWGAAFARQGHTGWADRQVYAYDQPLRRASVRRVLAQLHLNGLHGLDAVDVGCGTGDFALMLHEQGARVMAFDFCPEVLEAARNRLRRDADGIRFACASATDIPAPDGAADLVTSITVLQHLVADADLHRACHELHRILKPSGRVVLLELAPPLKEPNVSSDGHVIERPPATWRAVLQASGFRFEREATYPQWGITALRLLARAIDGMRGAAAPAPFESRSAGTGFVRRALRTGLWFVRLLLLAAAWPMDHLLCLSVPERYRYYRLWILQTT